MRNAAYDQRNTVLHNVVYRNLRESSLLQRFNGAQYLEDYNDDPKRENGRQSSFLRHPYLEILQHPYRERHDYMFDVSVAPQKCMMRLQGKRSQVETGLLELMDEPATSVATLTAHVYFNSCFPYRRLPGVVHCTSGR